MIGSILAKLWSFDQLTNINVNTLQILSIFPDDLLINPEEIPIIVTTNYESFDEILNQLLSMKLDWAWDASNFTLHVDLKYMIKFAIKTFNSKHLQRIASVIDDRISMGHIRQWNEYEDEFDSEETVLKCIGLVPPKYSSQEEKDFYIKDGLNPLYLMKHSESDIAILEKARRIGFEYFYSTRKKLLKHYRNFVFKDGPLIFKVLPPLYKNSINQELNIMLEKLWEVQDDILIGIGKINEFYTCSYQELLGVIDLDAVKIMKIFTGTYNSIKSKNIISVAIIILKYIGHLKESDELEKKYQRYLEIKSDLKRLVGVYVDEFNTMDNHNKTKIIGLLTKLFMTGMMMRGWKYYDPYPIRAVDTKFKDDLEHQHACIAMFLDSLNREDNYIAKEFLFKLPSFCLNINDGNKLSCSKMTTKTMIEKVTSGDACIKIFSSLLVATSNTYVKLLTNVDLLPNVEELEYIS